VAQDSTGRDGQSLRFAMAKFRPTTLPGTLVARPSLLGRLDEGAGKRLTVVVGSAGTGKSVLGGDAAAGSDLLAVG
jgi:ATP/maltotriose-dependent transcriptional regulator MalT